MNEFHPTWRRERHDKIIRVLCDDHLPFYMNGCSLRCARTAIFLLFLENKAEFQEIAKLKQLKSSYSLSSCLFDVLKVRHLLDQPLTDRPTDRQADRQTDRQTNRQTKNVTIITL